MAENPHRFAIRARIASPIIAEPSSMKSQEVFGTASHICFPKCTLPRRLVASKRFTRQIQFWRAQIHRLMRCSDSKVSNCLCVAPSIWSGQENKLHEQHDTTN